MPRPTPGVSWRRCKVSNSKGQYRITFPKDFAESKEILEGTFEYDPAKREVFFRKNSRQT